MNGHASQHLNEDAFGDSRSGLKTGLRTFDAFPKTKRSYTTASRRGGQWTVVIFAICAVLSITELYSWFKGTESHHFSVEKGVSHELQLNLDIVVHMSCDTLRVNIQDAAGDHILAGDLLKKEKTSWKLWMDKRNFESSNGVFEYQTLSQEDKSRLLEQEEDVHSRHVLGEIRRNSHKKFPSGPKMHKRGVADSCRIFGSLVGNKVQGNFHITARGHGYYENAPHLDHSSFNFSHMVTELSFGPHYPTLLNPLDKTIAMADSHFHRYQYFLSIVPTIYSEGSRGSIDAYAAAHGSVRPRHTRNMIFTNQYAATSQSDALLESPDNVPGIFFKYNIEPILLLINQERSSLLALVIRLVNTAAGVLVTGGWLYQMCIWWTELIYQKRARTKSEGVLNGKPNMDN